MKAISSGASRDSWIQGLDPPTARGAGPFACCVLVSATRKAEVKEFHGLDLEAFLGNFRQEPT